MIAKLKGIIDSILTHTAIIDVGGVGYDVYCSGHTLRQLGQSGDEAVLFIETHVREDHIHLYGFADQSEKEAFQLLIKVNGVGAKMALAILSVLTPSQLATAIAAQDKAAFTSVSGVGPKLASRLITELKDKFQFGAEENAVLHASQNVAQTNNDIADAVIALVGLGYSRSDAYATVTKIAARNDNTPIDMLIKQGLQELSNR